MGKSIIELCEGLSNNPFLNDACEKVYYTLVNSRYTLINSRESMFECEISQEVASKEVLGRNHIHHSAYLRTALDILVSEDLVKKKGALYSTG